MMKLIVAGAFILLATSAWSQPSFAQGDSAARKPVNTVSQLGPANFPGPVGLQKAAEKWKAPWSGRNPGKHGAPLPVAGGLSALALMGIAMAWASRRRSTGSPPSSDVTGA